MSHSRSLARPVGAQLAAEAAASDVTVLDTGLLRAVSPTPARE
ncbi:hypothetical protein ACWEPM_36630 [Streptomyces sp. NPDC004244]